MIACVHFHVGAFVLVGIEENHFGVAQQLAEQTGQLRHPAYGGYPGNLRGFLLGMLVSLPDGTERGWLAQEKNFAVAWIKRIRSEQQYGFFLFDAGEVEQVGVGLHGQQRIGVGGE